MCPDFPREIETPWGFIRCDNRAEALFLEHLRFKKKPAELVFRGDSDRAEIVGFRVPFLDTTGEKWVQAQHYPTFIVNDRTITEVRPDDWLADRGNVDRWVATRIWCQDHRVGYELWEFTPTNATPRLSERLTLAR